nr:flagellar basal body P-ring protein FlgI [Kofleriaceae bacterium]
MSLISLAVAVAAVNAPAAHADRVKDLTTIAGVRDNHITGFGLVVGLDGTGDDIRSPAVKTALTKMMKRLGLTIDPTDLKAKNVAAVAITAELPAFGKPGMAIDITASSLGNATSLAGGTLLAAPIKGPDGKTWAVAQGALSVGGVSAGGANASQKKNHLTVGIIPGGATVEGDAPTQMPDKQIVLLLKDPDFTTATRMTAALNQALGADLVTTRDAGSVIVGITPEAKKDVPALIAKLEAVEVEPDVPAKVVVDEKTGTIVVGEAVSLRPAAITFGSLVVEVQETPQVSQPDALTKGKTTVVKQTDLKVDEQDHPLRVLSKATTVGDVAAALAALGAKPRDLVSILRALKAAGALRAELEMI